MKRLFKADPRELFDACESGDDVLVKKKLAFSVDVNAIDVTSGQTPLTCAVYKGHTPIVKLLLADKRINVNGVNSLQMTPFLAACHAGIPELVQLLASDRRIDLNAQADGGPTGLHLAFLSKRADLVSIIIQEGMNNGRLDLGLRDGKTGTSALDAAASDPELKKLLDIALAESVNSLSLKSMDLMKACSAGTVNNVKLLLVDPSIDVNFQDKATGATPLIEACLAGHLQIVQLLLADPRCEPNMVIPSLNNQSVVHIVASKGKDKVLALLIKSASGINLNAQDSLGNTPLILACRGKQSKCAELLLKQVPSGRVDLGIMNKEGLMAVDVAEEPERGVICALLPERDGDKVEQNPRGLFGKLRGRTGSGVVSKAETGSGAKVGATDTTTSSSIDTTLNDAFVQACSSGDLITVDTFLSDSAQNPNVASLAMNGWTGFQAACASNQLHVVERLLGDTRVDPNLTDSNGRTGFFIACAGNAEQVISLLLETPVVDVTKPAKGLFGIGGKKPQDAGNAATYKLVKEGVAKRLASSSGLLRLGSRDSGELSKRPSTMDFGGQDQSVPSNEKELPVAHAVLEQMQVQQNGVYNEDASKQPDRGTTVPSPFPVLEPTQPNNPFPPQTTPISSMSTSTALSSSYSSPPPSSTPDLSAVELEARIWRQEEQLFLQEKLRLEEETYRRRLDDEQRFQMKKMEMEEVARGRELQRQKEELRVQRELLNVQEKMARLELLEKEKEGMGREESGATVVGEEAAELLDRAGWVNGLLLSPVDLELEDENKLGEKVTRGRYLGLVDVVARSVDVGDAELVRVVRSWSHVPGHDNIMPLIGYQSFPYPILVTKYCPAGNLRTYLESQNWPSDYKMTLPLLKGIATGLAVLHSKGLAHGNLKLNNVLVDVVGSATPRVKLTDFMIPMMQISPSKSKTDTMSTLRMCPPEYFDDEPWNLAMDVWSFGMLGFVVVSGGEEPYKGVESKIGVGFGDGGDGGEDAGVLSWGVERIMRAIVKNVRPAKPEHVPEDLWCIIESCWAEVPGERPGMIEIARHLHELE